MAIYVDELRYYSQQMIKKNAKKYGNKWSHLITDGDIDELHKFAKSIDLKKSWFQNHKTLPHYDLVESKRVLAIQKGAIEISAIDAVKRCSKLFKKD